MDSKNSKSSCAPTTKTNKKISTNPAFLVVHATGEKPLAKASPFLIQKLFESTIGQLKKIQKLRSGDLLVETASPQQSAKLLETKTLGEMEVTVTPHVSLNSSRGVISEIDLISEDESDIQIGLSDQGVTAVRRISIRRDGKLIPTKHLILTFNKPTLPSVITAGYLRCPVRPYVPNPLRCFKCQRFGHSQTSCRGKSICAQCGTEGHESTECTTTPCCVNCKDAHPAYSRKCLAWQREKEIQRVKTINNIPYPEARRMVTQSTVVKQKTFASVLKSTMSCGVQTDISVSPSESLTRHAKCLILPSTQTPEKEITKGKTPLPKTGVITRNLGSKKANKNPLNKQRVKAALSKSKKSEAQSMSEFSDISDEENNMEVTQPTSPPKGKSSVKLKRDTFSKNAASNT
ncbi:uncharacterized protein LOC111641285 [Centruroides sculpturatus]|uniref:uncharacterized protein LOC111615434 n=2 Tax=Centruroides sculpturatus TaxID=218467 RepID=UPI000C6DF8DA|nr:uncharacterized protein LOC111615434 [Centruroides sculpturatus]XP_023228590.1 uncharacterized protein LOC111628964 [Centruroides sculpturatus]XP_023229776.1 uncharacterized protein LOC111630016 [Centruroides sculpturatus]XP_023230408.1 uncharacterized protein LOC111630524 [Centruroides sculpturatus]XP_023235739.1 uncharacterized protein LOC111635110 [Centruroides sculpturatus]XP_023240499.1 uncharacterized protein LOC111638951 [Centruroides sculpturatus]XP_023243205.1 uncharacterized prot